jgi:hypothetical protein
MEAKGIFNAPQARLLYNSHGLALSFPQSGPPKKPAPEKWKPRAIARDQMVASLASHSRTDLVVDSAEADIDGEEYISTGAQVRNFW